MSLLDNTEYASTKEYFSKNQDKVWSEWLSYDQTFPKLGKQGLVGIMKTRDEAPSQGSEHNVVFKISQYINYLVHHEYTVMKGLNELSPYCPHFCKMLGIVSAQVDPMCRKSGNPFRHSSHPIEKEVLLIEHVDKATKFYNYIRNTDKIEDKVIYSTIKQTLLAVAIAQKKKQFTHYDLHSDNIMMKRCDKNLVFLYVIDELTQFAVPTYGHYPVIIDFGFSYIADLKDGPAWPSMAHTDVGFMSDRHDWVADPKLFLVTVADEMREKRRGKTTDKFRCIVKNIFNLLKIDWESGWDTEDDMGALDYVADMLDGYNTKSHIFDKYSHYCMDIIQSLIILPFEEQSYDNIQQSYVAFLKEFIKIENEIGNPFYNLYILKGMIDIAREVRPDYVEMSTRNKAVTYFRQEVHSRINCVAKFCRPKGVHFEKMLCALLCLAKNVEGVLFDVCSTRMSKKEKQYAKLPLQSVVQIYGAIDVNIPDKYQYTQDTTVIVLDCVNEKCAKMEIKQEICDDLNNSRSINNGSILYDEYVKNLIL
jgi:hypothetical protein